MRTLRDLREWLASAPPGTTLPAAAVLELIDSELPDHSAGNTAPALPDPSWRERLWTAPAETRIGARELLEATGKKKSWMYRHTSRKSGLPLLPHRKLDGELVFVVGEVRAWLREHEEIIEAGPMDSTTAERLRLAR